jgi:DNA polymerase-3 subunit delta'
MHPWNELIFDGIRHRVEELPHAMLIHGPQGVGKLALAERIAQLILCEAPKTATRPCGACEGCRWYLAGNHPDFRRIEPEALAPKMEAEGEGGDTPAPKSKAKPSTEIKIDQIRALSGFLNVGSHRGRRRLALVHPAEEMNLNAANALLKGLEEPPGGAMFILVSHRPARLLPTIRSRCVAIPVPKPAADVAAAWLAAQGVRDATRWLAYAGGAPLAAQAYAADSGAVQRLLEAVASGRPVLPDTREDLEALAEVLQKYAIDNALAAMGLAPIYGLAKARGAAQLDQAFEWATFARRMGPARALSSHPLNPRLFAADLQAELPEPKK